MKRKMKSVILALALVVTSLAVNAQSFKKSDKFVEGTVSYTKTTDVDASYGIKPTIGYFVTDRVAVGLFGEGTKAGDTKTTNIGAFARCYFLNIGQHCKTFSQLDVASNSTNVSGTKSSAVAANLGLGVNYFVSSRLGLTMNVANLISYESADSKSTTTIGFSGINNPFATAKFGVIYKF
jgi:outer membrane protein